MIESVDQAGTGVRERLNPLYGRATEMIRRLNARDGLSPGWLLVVFVIALFAIFARDPTLFTRPQFWAEDGKVWYAQAYNGGWLHSLTQPLGGYLNTLQRLGAGAALLVPFRWAPLVMALEGLILQALPVPILVSARCRRWAPLSLRVLFAIVYIGIPNSREVHVLCTNCHWHLAVVEVLLAFAAAPRSTFGRVSDIAVFMLAPICGPFAVLLLPFLFAYWWIGRERWSLILLAVLGAGSLFQLALLRHYQMARNARYLGANIDRFIRLLGGNVFLAALRGSTPYGYNHRLVYSLVALVIGLAVIGYCFRFVSVELKLFFLYCFGIFAASLRSPLLPETTLPLWEGILRESAIRYWYFPSFPFLFAILWCAFYARSRAMRLGGLFLTVIVAWGICRDWRIPGLNDLHFPQYAAAFDAAPHGAHVRIPLNPLPADPKGERWFMDLLKK